MLKNISIIFLNKNVLLFLIAVLFITAILIKYFPVFSDHSIKKRFFSLKEFIVQFTFGLSISTCLTFINVITPPLTFYNKNLFLKNDCHNLPGCITKEGLFYIPHTTIQYSNNPDFFKITYEHKNNDGSQENQIFLNKKYIFGWEQSNA